ncbi:MAG: hypothetical protein HC918_12335 [Oscillatoriales cyanobacterium SM2_1_8]|nr:hypothetical protein [Oscillatoriales cyanobacterium SM2_1_8]
MQALLLNSADKIRDRDRLSDREVRDVHGRTWLESDAFANGAHPLSRHLGAGHLNATAAWHNLRRPAHPRPRARRGLVHRDPIPNPPRLHPPPRSRSLQRHPHLAAAGRFGGWQRQRSIRPRRILRGAPRAPPRPRTPRRRRSPHCPLR